MAFNVIFGLNVTAGTDAITNDSTFSCQTKVYMEETVANGVSNQQHLVSLDISTLKVLAMVSDQDITVETNDGTTPDDSFSLTAGVPVTFKEGDGAIFTADVTSLYLTNSSGSNATFTLLAGLDG